MRSVVALAVATIRRILRDRVAAFFLLALPFIVILIVGGTVRGLDRFDVAVVDEGAGALGASLEDALDGADTLRVETMDSVDEARTALRRDEIDAVVVLPAGMDAELRAGRSVEIPVLGEQADSFQQAARSAIAGVLAEHAGTVQAAVFAAEQAGGSVDEQLALVTEIAAAGGELGVETKVVDAVSDRLPEGYSYGAATMLVLFVFINAVAAGAAVIETRQLGIHARMLAAPTGPGAVVLGEGASAFTVAATQSAVIVVAGALLFGVDWGDPLAAAVLLIVWALVGTGAGMLSGSLFHTPEQAGSIGPPVGIALGMLGGCMWPLDIVGEPMQRIGHLVPHAWAVDAWIELLSRGGGLIDIWRELVVLASFAVVLLTVASIRLRRTIVS